MSSNAEFLSGSAAETLLHDPALGQAWDALHARCPWRTVFQSRPFVTAWFETHLPAVQPILLLARDGQGRLRGLLPLGQKRASGELLPPGGNDGEYQGWLADEEWAGAFPAAALAELNRQRPGLEVVFPFLPPGTPLDWLADSPLRYELQTRRRPLLHLEGGRPQASLRKKSNRSRLNRLERLGEFRFERVTDPGPLERWMDTLIACADLRHGAVHEVLPFGRDPLRRDFLLDLQRAGLLYTTLLTIDGELVSAHLDPIGEGVVHLGAIAHAPGYAAHSPGKLHILLLAQRLAEEGFATFDLTPGGDAYKERFADDHDEIHRLRVFGGARPYLAHTTVRTAGNAARSALRAVRIQPHTAWVSARRVLDVQPRRVAGLVRQASQRVRRDGEYRLYSCDLRTPPEPPESPVPCNQLGDLLAYRPPKGATRQGFLAQALERLEQGCRVYTLRQDTRLAYWGWVMEAAPALDAQAVGQQFRLPERSVCLFDLGGAPAIDEPALLDRTLRQMLTDLAGRDGLERAYLGLPADREDLCRQVEQLGFLHELSGYERVRWGRAWRWMSCRPTGQPATPRTCHSPTCCLQTRVPQLTQNR